MRILGIDIGGTEIKIAEVVMEGSRQKRGLSMSIRTSKTKKRLLATISRAVELFIKHGALFGIGIGAPGIVNLKNGVLVHAPNLLFLNRWNVKSFFRRFKVPVKIDNDSRCFLRAEALYGAGRNKKYIATVVIGTGVGGGLLINGKVYFGARGGAGEFGHMVINHGKTLEQLAGKNAFAQREDKNKIIGIGVANIINAFDPEAVILGGGAIYTKRLSIKKIRLAARRHIMSPFGKKTPIIAGRIGEYAGALGAASLFRK